jgi:uncharacterized protein YdbL (DUF1318 family)
VEGETKMKKTFLSMVAAGLLVSTAGIASAQEGRIQERKENQQQRIGEGVENGSLTPNETRKLESKETNLNKEIRHDRRQNGGNLTNKEKAQINRQQNRLSKDIYKQKHDGQHR